MQKRMTCARGRPSQRFPPGALGCRVLAETEMEFADDLVPPGLMVGFRTAVPTSSDVAAELNERSGGAVFSASTRPWNSFSVARLAKHPLYTGMINRGFRGLARLLDGKSAILRRPGRVGWLSYPHLAHVDRFLWERANARLR